MELIGINEDKMTSKCDRCGVDLTHEILSAVYDEPPFYCSEGCMFNKGKLYFLYWKIIKLLKTHIFKNWVYG